MSLLRRGLAGEQVISGVSKPGITALSRAGTSTALNQSVVWASMRLRASTEALMPVDVFRRIDGAAMEVPKPPVLVTPSFFAEGHPDTIADWLYAGRMSLDGYGNSFGEIVARNAIGLPQRIQLVPAEDVRCRVKSTQIVEYRFGGKVMDPSRVWHERQYLMGGNPVGLGPLAHAALSVATSAAAREFLAEWFGNHAAPGGHFKKTDRVLAPGDAESIESRFNERVRAGGLLVTGSDWTYSPIQAKAAEAGLLEAINATALDQVRFLGVMADMVDVALDGGSAITYANITQKNMQYLVMNMGHPLKARDDALSTLTPKPQFVKLNRSAFLAMDPLTRAELMKSRIDSRTLTPSEARALEDQPRLTDDDIAEFDRLFGNPNKSTPQKEIA